MLARLGRLVSFFPRDFLEAAIMNDTSNDPAPVRVRTVNPHTYRGATYDEGAEYDVTSEAGRTADEWVETLEALSYARRVPPAAVVGKKGKKTDADL